MISVTSTSEQSVGFFCLRSDHSPKPSSWTIDFIFFFLIIYMRFFKIRKKYVMKRLIRFKNYNN